MIDRFISSIKDSRFEEDIEPVFGENQSIVPGFVDTHSHMAEHGFFMQYPSLSGFKSKKELLEYVASMVVTGELNIFVDYDETLFTDEKSIVKDDLDRISKITPILLRRVCGHIAILNTPAIRYFEGIIPDNTLDVERGIAMEYLPLRLYEILKPDVDRIEKGILIAQEKYLKKGITGVLDFAKDINVFDAYLNLDRKGKLKIKVAVAFYEDAFSLVLERGLNTGWKKGRVKVEGIKLFLDGSVGGRTASFYKPYRDSEAKATFYDITILREKIKKYEKNGFKVLMHAIGTRAIDTALEVIPDFPDFAHRIEHFEFPHKEALKIAKKKGVHISMQPNFVKRWWKMYKESLYDNAFSLMHPYKSMRNMGIMFAFGSDSMPEGPAYGLKGAVNHPVKEERLTFKESIMYYTEKGSDMLKINTGKMRKGFYGDFVVLDIDGNIKTVFVEGKKVYGRGDN